MFKFSFIFLIFIFNLSFSNERTIQNDFDNKIKNFILKNPEVIIKSLKIYEENQAKEEEKEKNKFISENSEEIYKSNGNLYDGKVDSDLIIVEYFDYNCGYCKKFHQELRSALKEEQNLKVVYKNLPVLSENSKFLAKISIAIGLTSNKNFLSFHEFVMNSKKQIKENDLKMKIQNLNLDYSKILELSKSKEIEKIIVKNFIQANSLGIRGTPAIVVKNEVIEGYVSRKLIRSLLQTQQ